MATCLSQIRIENTWKHAEQSLLVMNYLNLCHHGATWVEPIFSFPWFFVAVRIAIRLFGFIWRVFLYHFLQEENQAKFMEIQQMFVASDGSASASKIHHPGLSNSIFGTAKAANRYKHHKSNVRPKLGYIKRLQKGCEWWGDSINERNHPWFFTSLRKWQPQDGFSLRLWEFCGFHLLCWSILDP